MATYEVTEHDQRLDEVVLQYYGNLHMFDAVLAANPDINAVFLNKGQQLLMPSVERTETSEVLW